MAAKTPLNALNAWATYTLEKVAFHLKGLDETAEVAKPEFVPGSSSPLFVDAKCYLRGDIPADFRVSLAFDWIHHADKFVRVTLRFARPDRGPVEVTRAFPHDISDSEVFMAVTEFLYPLLDDRKAA